MKYFFFQLKRLWKCIFNSIYNVLIIFSSALFVFSQHFLLINETSTYAFDKVYIILNIFVKNRVVNEPHMVYKVTILCFLNLTAKIYRYACHFMSYFYLHPIHCVLFLFTPKCNEFKMMNSSLFFKNHFRFVCICL